jgi:hypothetical protein
MVSGNSYFLSILDSGIQNGLHVVSVENPELAS